MKVKKKFLGWAIKISRQRTIVLSEVMDAKDFELVKRIAPEYLEEIKKPKKKEVKSEDKD